MPNTLNTSTLISKQIVQSLEARGKLINTVNTNLTRDFTQKKYTPGTTVSYNVMHQPNVTTGAVANVEDHVDRTGDITIVQYNTAQTFTSLEKGYSMDDEKDIRRCADDMAMRLVRKIEDVGFETLAQNVGNYVGTPGVDAGALRTWSEARAKLADGLAPDRDYFAAVNPMGMVALTDSLKGAQNPGKEISNQYLRGKMKRAAGLNFYESPCVERWTSGTTTDFALAMSATTTSGSSSLAMDAAGTGTITAGTKLTVAAVNAVDPQSKSTLSYAKEFTVTTTATIAGNAVTLVVSPTPYDSSSPHQNVDAMPQNNAVVTIVNSGSGSGSEVDAQNAVYDRDAVRLVSVPLPAAKRSGVHTFGSYNGINIRIGIGSWDAVNDDQILRCDAVAGWAIPRPEHACIVFGD